MYQDKFGCCIREKNERVTRVKVETVVRKVRDDDDLGQAGSHEIDESCTELYLI